MRRSTLRLWLTALVITAQATTSFTLLPRTKVAFAATQIIQDDFETDSYTGGSPNGAGGWVGAWFEVNEDSQNASLGEIRLLNDSGDIALRVGGPNNYIYRQVDLAGAASAATLRFDYRLQGLDDVNDNVVVEISRSGAGGPWAELARYQGAGDDANYTSATPLNILPYASAETVIRFHTSTRTDSTDSILFDNVEISYNDVPAAGQINGLVFMDSNVDGAKAREAGVSGVVIKAYAAGSNTAAASATTDAAGGYTLTGLSDGVTYRLEMTNLPSGYQSGPIGADSRSSVVFAHSPAVHVDFGVLSPGTQACANARLASCAQVSGDPIGGGSTGQRTAIFSYPYNASGVTTGDSTAPVQTPMTPSKDAKMADVGSVWGLAHQAQSHKLFSAALIKRHVGLGSLGTGGIYVTDYSGATPVTSAYVDVKSLGINTGSFSAARSLPADIDQPSTDAETFDAVGKLGIGDIDLSNDGATLYLVNLNDRHVYGIAIGNPAKAGNTLTAADVTDYGAVPASCSNGVFRPFALKFAQGSLYVGGVCTAENSGGTATDLSASVYKVAGVNSYSPVLAIPAGSLNYPRPTISGDCSTNAATWKPWIDQWSDLSIVFGSSFVLCNPQPMLSDLEFLEDGSMVLGFMDRTGHQSGEGQPDTGGASAGFHRPYASGDLLIASYNGGVYTLENNGAYGSNSATWGGVGNNEGPGGGEFFRDVSQISSDIPEITLGGLAYLPGSGEVVGHGWDVHEGFDAGAIWWSTSSGIQNRSYQLLRDLNKPGEMGKGNALGDIEIMCDPAPIEVGNRVWHDANGNGIQDADEAGINGLTVQLYQGSNLLGTTVTANGGLYSFSSATGSDTDNAKYGLNLQANTAYELRIASAQAPLNGLSLTVANAPQPANGNASAANNSPLNDVADSDALVNGVHAVISFTTGAAGANNHGLDFGFQTTPAINYTLSKRLNTPEPVRNGAPLSFTITITNTGAAVITALPLSDTYSTNYLTFVSANPAADDDNNDGQIDWSDVTAGCGDLAANGGHCSIVVNFLAKADTSRLPGGATVNLAQSGSVMSTAPVRILAPTAVAMAERSVSNADGRVMVQWRTVNENNVVGFYLWREDALGQMVKLSQEPISAQKSGQASGAVYSYSDTTANKDGYYRYMLEVIEVSGVSSYSDVGMIGARTHLWLPVVTQ
jgi:hypothetical protein